MKSGRSGARCSQGDSIQAAEEPLWKTSKLQVLCSAPLNQNLRTRGLGICIPTLLSPLGLGAVLQCLHPLAQPEVGLLRSKVKGEGVVPGDVFNPLPQ